MEKFELFKRNDYVKFGFVLAIGNESINNVKACQTGEPQRYSHYNVVGKKEMKEIMLESQLEYSVSLEVIFGGRKNLMDLFFGTYPEIIISKEKNLIKVRQYFLVGEYATKQEQLQTKWDNYNEIAKDNIEPIIRIGIDGKTTEYSNERLVVKEDETIESGITIINHGQITIEVKDNPLRGKDFD